MDLAAPVPPGALATAAPEALAARLEGTGAHWWHGGDLTAAGWPARLGGVDAVPTDPNTGHAGRDLSRGLRCTPGTHCGLVAVGAAPDATTATIALRWTTPPGEAGRTLVTLNTGGASRKSPDENYLFLAESDGILTAQDDAGLVAVSLPCHGPGPHLAIVSLRNDDLRLAAGGAAERARAAGTVLKGAASLFIAARNQRPKLFKTLGGATIHDVFLWPGRALLHEDGAGALAALERHHLWAGA